EIALETKNKPTAIITIRQSVKNLSTTHKSGVLKGAYIIDAETSRLDGIILAAGSEVSLAVEAKALLKEKGLDIRVVSMPSMDRFLLQDPAYQQQILPANVKTLAVELGSSYSWYRFTQHVMGIDTYGISGNLEQVTAHFGFTKENVAKRFLEI